MCAKLCGVPDVVVVCVLRVALVLNFGAVNVDGWRGSVGHCVFGNRHVAHACAAALPCYGEAYGCFARGFICADGCAGYLRAGYIAAKTQSYVVAAAGLGLDAVLLRSRCWRGGWGWRGGGGRA